jgi:hypothetical protein
VMQPCLFLNFAGLRSALKIPYCNDVFRACRNSSSAFKYYDTNVQGYPLNATRQLY